VEKAFKLYEDTIDGVEEELARRGWNKLNGLIKEANSSMAVKIFATAFQGDENDPPFESVLREVRVPYDEDTINDMLQLKVSLHCGVEKRMRELEDVKSLNGIWKLEIIRDELCIEGTLWMQQAKGCLPKKFGFKYMKPEARAWGTFVMHTLESCGNSSEFRPVNVVVVQAI